MKRLVGLLGVSLGLYLMGLGVINVLNQVYDFGIFLTLAGLIAVTFGCIIWAAGS